VVLTWAPAGAPDPLAGADEVVSGGGARSRAV